MSNLTITNNDNGSVVIEEWGWQDDILVFAGAGTVVEGTILARSTVDSKMHVYDTAGINGLNIPKAVITYDVAATGAGDVPIRQLIAGKVKKERLVIDADGDDSNITKAILDELRDFVVVPQNVQDLSVLDFQ